MPEVDVNPNPLNEPSQGFVRPGKPFSLADIAWVAFDDLVVPDIELPESEPLRSELVVTEQNISFRYVVGSTDTRNRVPGVLPGRLELELRATSGKEIDTITFTKLTAESLGRILDVMLDYDDRQPFAGLSAFEDPILPPGKLKHLLETAGSLGASFETKLGALPLDIMRRYSQRMTKQPEEEAPEEQVLRVHDRMLTYSIISQGIDLAVRHGVSQLIVHADSPSTVAEINRARGTLGVIWIVGNDRVPESSTLGNDMVYEVRNAELGKQNQVHLALFSALLQGRVALGERVLTFSGPDDSRHIDRIAFAVPGREFSWLNAASLAALKACTNRHVLERVINIALRLGSEGLEGNRIGATFVIGEGEELEPHVKQALLNPFEGHPESKRSVFDRGFLETLRAFASIDGAVLISPSGVAERACVLIRAHADAVEAKPEWGARHISAASITAASKALAVVISQTTGMVTVMWDGKPLLELESW